MIAFGLAVFTGALLLFEAQPIVARYILPWFGGGPGVWTTCVLFFQVALLVGYGYAHLLSGLRLRVQVIVHLTLVAAALGLLPVTPSVAWKPDGTGNPSARILALLICTLGIHAVVLAATGPLLQRWFLIWSRGRSPYRLYAVSNLGSLLALVTYPILVEPLLSRRAQTILWSTGFALFAALMVWCAARVTRVVEQEPPAELDSAADVPAVAARVLWFLLSACGAVLLLAVTNQLCLDVAVIPFLWILPLSIYLATFILCFHDARWYPRAVFLCLLQAGLAAEAWVLALSANKDASVPLQIGVHASVLFVCCMVCHGELVRLKPVPRRLTAFYLTVAAGGAAGGAFVTLLAPLIFRGYFELQLGLVSSLLLLLAAAYFDRAWLLYHGRPLWAWIPLAVLVVALSAILWREAHTAIDRASEVTRNFYGVLAVSLYDADQPEATRFILTHGSTLHGLQFAKPEKRAWPTSYYGPESGVGLAIWHCQRRGPIRVGAVGLGVGTIAAYGRAGDSFRFYEINPEVKRIAETDFSYLADSAATIEVVLGDARISLEREEPQGFDVLVLDAFSSDAVPVHLLTKEAFEVYSRHLAPGGVIAVHISNVYLDLRPVVFGQADRLGLPKALVTDFRAKRSGSAAAIADILRGVETSFWVLMTRDTTLFDSESVRRGMAAPQTEVKRIALWTDDRSNLLQLLRRD